MISLSHTFSQKQATFIVIGLIFVSFWIAVLGEWFSLHTPTQGSWEIAFIKPQDDTSLDFFIFNASKKNIFSYTIIQESSVVEKGEIEVDFNEKKEIFFEEKKFFEKGGEGLYRIEIEDASGKRRDIYRYVTL
jgi:hypothetical protein